MSHRTKSVVRSAAASNLPGTQTQDTSGQDSASDGEGEWQVYTTHHQRAPPPPRRGRRARGVPRPPPPPRPDPGDQAAVLRAGTAVQGLSWRDTRNTFYRPRPATVVQRAPPPPPLPCFACDTCILTRALPCGRGVCKECARNMRSSLVENALLSIDGKAAVTVGDILIMCPCCCGQTFKLAAYDTVLQPLGVSIRRDLMVALDTYRAVAGAVSDRAVLDRKLCPQCRMPCSKNVRRHTSGLGGLAGGTEDCNHIECPVCHASLCFVCMRTAVDCARAAAGGGTACPRYDIIVELATAGAGWAVTRFATEVCTLWSVAVVDMETRAVTVQRMPAHYQRQYGVPQECEAASLLSSDSPDVLTPTSHHLCVFVMRGIVQRIAMPTGDAPFEQPLPPAGTLVATDGAVVTIFEGHVQAVKPGPAAEGAVLEAADAPARTPSQARAAMRALVRGLTALSLATPPWSPPPPPDATEATEATEATGPLQRQLSAIII